MVKKLFPDPLRENQNWAYVWINIVQSFIQFVFIVCQVECYRNILKLSCKPLAFTSYKAFLKNKKRSETCFPDSFSAWFLKKKISFVIFYYLTKFHWLVGCFYTAWDIGQFVYFNCLLTRLWGNKFWS